MNHLTNAHQVKEEKKMQENFLYKIKYEVQQKKNACIYLMWLHILNQNWYWKHAPPRDNERDINT
ncbi:hypothetical protein NC652_019976 [Populus alba x Populus x berolinensis]|nr:hypothetical protein NC652_019976 [Populus alba x Populus x berolinensis]